MTGARASHQKTRTFWFVLTSAVILCGDLLAVLLPQGALDLRLGIGYSSLSHLSLVPSQWPSARQSLLLEVAVIADLGILIPVLYWLLCRGPWKRTVIRVASLACLGIWGASVLVPAEQQRLLEVVRPLRDLGSIGLLLLEVFILLKIYQAVFAGTSSKDLAADLQANAGVPEWVTRLTALEAAFAHRLWRRIRRMVHAAFGRHDA